MIRLLQYTVWGGALVDRHSSLWSCSSYIGFQFAPGHNARCFKALYSLEPAYLNTTFFHMNIPIYSSHLQRPCFKYCLNLRLSRWKPKKGPYWSWHHNSGNPFAMRIICLLLYYASRWEHFLFCLAYPSNCYWLSSLDLVLCVFLYFYWIVIYIFMLHVVWMLKWFNALMFNILGER